MEGSFEAQCPICVDNYTKQLRKPVSCMKCGYTCCTVCFKQHCLTGADIMCMNPDCRSLFKEDFIHKVLSASFLKGEYKKKRIENLMEREKSMMETTMPLVQATIRKNEAQNKKREIAEIYSKLLKEQEEIIKESERIIKGKKAETEDNKRRTYLKKCPTDGCLGFLNAQYNCDICKKSTCSKCFETKEEGHECNPETLATAEMLKKDTKGCPQCGEMIHKSYGCDQMYCTSCHTVFSWNTGKITTGIVHNPHYFEYQRRLNNGEVDRNVLDIPCGGLPQFHSLQRKVKGISESLYNNHKLDLERFWRFCAELRDEYIPGINAQDKFELTKSERISYMMKNMSEESFKKSIYRSDINSIKDSEVIQVYNTLAILLEDQMRNISICDNSEDFINIIKEVFRIVSYINEIFKDLSRTFKMRMPLVVIPEYGDINNQQNRRYYRYYGSRIVINRNGTSYK